MLTIVMEKIKNFTILILFLTCIILFLTRGCNHKCSDPIVMHDTVTWTTVDTFIPEPKTITKIVKQFIPIGDTIIINNTPTFVNIYKDSLVDDNLAITWLDTVEGKFIGKGVSYRLFVPKTILKKDFVQIKETTFLTKSPKFSIFAGGIVGGNKHELSSIQPIVGFTANQNAVFYGYNLINQSHNIGFTRTIFKSKK